MAIMNQKIRAAAARAAHEANRAWCILQNDTSQPPWEEAPRWAVESAMNGVDNVALGAGPRASHESWLAEKRATGWKYGPVKNPDLKEHPCMCDYEDLPEHQKAKDHIFVNVVRTFLHAAGVPLVEQTPPG